MAYKCQTLEDLPYASHSGLQMLPQYVVPIQKQRPYRVFHAENMV